MYVTGNTLHNMTSWQLKILQDKNKSRYSIPIIHGHPVFQIVNLADMIENSFSNGREFVLPFDVKEFSEPYYVE